MKHQILIYGANGYTGKLLARYAKQYNLVPVLAGRNETAIRSLAEELQFPYAVFSLDDEEVLKKQLEQVLIVIHAAGPFKQTAKQMVEACINTQTHYLDINGDISVFEFIKQYDAAAKKAGIMLMPGTGFDVVPTDCMALQLKELLPDATDLKLAFVPMGGSLESWYCYNDGQQTGRRWCCPY
ncbi:MAG: saccharopine dehydrogenase NADP-binding domain-containing protein [Chitinophagaceae bacterium]